MMIDLLRERKRQGMVEAARLCWEFNDWKRSRGFYRRIADFEALAFEFEHKAQVSGFPSLWPVGVREAADVGA